MRAFTTIPTAHAVAVASGLGAWMVDDDGRPYATALTWRDKPWPEETHTPENFLREFPPKPYSRVWHEAVNMGLGHLVPADTCPHDFVEVYPGTRRCTKCSVREIDGTLGAFRLMPKGA